MYDQNDEIMHNVGFAGNPWTVTVFDLDSDISLLNGTTTVSFLPANGQAVFDNLILNEDPDVTGQFYLSFTFAITNPSNHTISDVDSDLVAFFQPQENDECIEDEGSAFDRQETWTPDCDFVCLSPCADLGDLSDSLGQQCNAVETCEGVDKPTYASCNQSGCQCDMSSVPDPKEIDPADYITATCSPAGMQVEISKCVLNQFGFNLKDIYIHGPQQTSDFTTLASSADNNCRGSLEYHHGPEYVFGIDRSFSDCATQITNNGTHATYENAIQGSIGVINGLITRQVRQTMFLKFDKNFYI